MQGLSRSPAAPVALSRHFMDWGHTARSRLRGFHRGSSRCLTPRSISGCMSMKTRRASARCLPLVAFACALDPIACGHSSPIVYCRLRPRMHARVAICPSCRRRRCHCAYHVNNVSQRPLSFATAHVCRRRKGYQQGRASTLAPLFRAQGNGRRPCRRGCESDSRNSCVFGPAQLYQYLAIPMNSLI